MRLGTRGGGPGRTAATASSKARMIYDMLGHAGLYRALRVGIAALIVPALVAASPARAEDGGLFGFLRALGGGGEPAPAAAPAPTQSAPQHALRPLTVRRTKPRVAAKARARLASLPTKGGPVSIYTDPTLRGGDAVITKDGVRVFGGAAFSPARPYSDADFIAISASKSVNPNLRKTATDLNKLPHG